MLGFSKHLLPELKNGNESSTKYMLNNIHTMKEDKMKESRKGKKSIYNPVSRVSTDVPVFVQKKNEQMVNKGVIKECELVTGTAETAQGWAGVQ